MKIKILNKRSEASVRYLAHSKIWEDCMECSCGAGYESWEYNHENADGSEEWECEECGSTKQVCPQPMKHEYEQSGLIEGWPIEVDNNGARMELLQGVKKGNPTSRTYRITHNGRVFERTFSLPQQLLIYTRQL